MERSRPMRRAPRDNSREYLRRATEREAAERRLLLHEASRIRGSLRLNTWLRPGLALSGLATLAGSIALSNGEAAGFQVIAGIVGATALNAAALGIDIWSASRGITEERLDSVQRILLVRHNIRPDKGFVQRAKSERRHSIVQKARSEALAEGKEIYEYNPFGHRTLKPPYQD